MNDLKRWIYKKRGGEEINPILSALKEVFLKGRNYQPIINKMDEDIKDDDDTEDSEIAEEKTEDTDKEEAAV
jgi:hypothetical protein